MNTKCPKSTCVLFTIMRGREGGGGDTFIIHFWPCCTSGSSSSSCMWRAWRQRPFVRLAFAATAHQWWTLHRQRLVVVRNESPVIGGADFTTHLWRLKPLWRWTSTNGLFVQSDGTVGWMIFFLVIGKCYIFVRKISFCILVNYIYIYFTSHWWMNY